MELFKSGKLDCMKAGTFKRLAEVHKYLKSVYKAKDL